MSVVQVTDAATRARAFAFVTAAFGSQAHQLATISKAGASGFADLVRSSSESIMKFQRWGWEFRAIQAPPSSWLVRAEPARSGYVQAVTGAMHVASEARRSAPVGDVQIGALLTKLDENGTRAVAHLDALRPYESEADVLAMAQTAKLPEADSNELAILRQLEPDRLDNWGHMQSIKTIGGEKGDVKVWRRATLTPLPIDRVENMTADMRRLRDAGASTNRALEIARIGELAQLPATPNRQLELARGVRSDLAGAITDSFKVDENGLIVNLARMQDRIGTARARIAAMNLPGDAALSNLATSVAAIDNELTTLYRQAGDAPELRLDAHQAAELTAKLGHRVELTTSRQGFFGTKSVPRSSAEVEADVARLGDTVASQADWLVGSRAAEAELAGTGSAAHDAILDIASS